MSEKFDKLYGFLLDAAVVVFTWLMVAGAAVLLLLLIRVFLFGE